MFYGVASFLVASACSEFQVSHGVARGRGIESLLST